MVTVENYGKAEEAEVTEFQTGADECEQLASLLRKTSGVKTVATYIAGIDQAIALIDSIFTLKAKLEADKVILEAA
jgi:hypothetical protein